MRTVELLPGLPAWYDFDGIRYFRRRDTYYQSAKEERFGGRTKRLHVAVWEYANERELPPGYVVHHDDRDKTNNWPDNLVLLTHAEHSAIHAGEVVLSPETRARIRAKVIASWERRPYETFTCGLCGNEFKSRNSRGRARYCSQLCQKRARQGWAPSPINCAWCGKLIEHPKDRQQRCCPGKVCGYELVKRERRERNRARREARGAK